MTNAELAIMTLLAEKPRHGYEIEKIISDRGMREWTEVGFSSIYYLLNKLAKKGYIEGRLTQSQGRGPAQKVFQLTPGGGKALGEAALDALSSPQRCYTPFQLGLANLPGLDREDVLVALSQYRQTLAGRLDNIRQRRESQRPLPENVEAMFDYSLALVTAELRWVEAFIEKNKY